MTERRSAIVWLCYPSGASLITGRPFWLGSGPRCRPGSVPGQARSLFGSDLAPGAVPGLSRARLAPLRRHLPLGFLPAAEPVWPRGSSGFSLFSSRWTGFTSSYRVSLDGERILRRTVRNRLWQNPLFSLPGSAGFCSVSSAFFYRVESRSFEIGYGGCEPDCFHSNQATANQVAVIWFFSRFHEVFFAAQKNTSSSSHRQRDSS